MAAAIALGACRPPEAKCAQSCGTNGVVVHGACLSPDGAARYCGRAARWDRGACVARTCSGPAQVLDEVTGECHGVRALRAIGERQHIVVDEEHLLGCREGGVLRVADGHARCAPREEEEEAVSPDRCEYGGVLDPRARACVAVAGATLDVAAWSRAILGIDGGAGSRELCARATVDPAAYGILSGASSTVDVAIDLVFPNNDVTLVFARARTDRAVPPAAEALIQRAVAAEIELLRAFGGTASVGSFSTRIRCEARGDSAPIAIPVPPRERTSAISRRD